MLDIGGQEIMTADKVMLRLNAVATYRVADAHKAISATDNAQEALYCEAQLALTVSIVRPATPLVAQCTAGYTGAGKN